MCGAGKAEEARRGRLPRPSGTRGAAPRTRTSCRRMAAGTLRGNHRPRPIEPRFERGFVLKRRAMRGQGVAYDCTNTGHTPEGAGGIVMDSNSKSEPIARSEAELARQFADEYAGKVRCLFPDDDGRGFEASLFSGRPWRGDGRGIAAHRWYWEWADAPGCWRLQSPACSRGRFWCSTFSCDRSGWCAVSGPGPWRTCGDSAWRTGSCRMAACGRPLMRVGGTQADKDDGVGPSGRSRKRRDL